ncbi:MAG TPA: type I restriction-modification enzyme R subunit C-terminal domain-containing protein [Solirubrobacterales bacterium]|nr:type I restriction-modification enzyme R subunit C-terminal domain-containing protein [Solirubrobacterales bacterium]
MVDPNLTPEQRSRVLIDRLLSEAGWVVQNRDEVNLAAGRGIAVREFRTATGPVDYLLYGDRKVLGTLEAKRDGTPLLGVESQSDRYADGFASAARQKGLPFWRLPLPFHYMSTGKETYFANRLDPGYAPREVFAFHKPETLIDMAKSGASLRRRLRAMPALNPEGLWANQVEAIENLEGSFGRNRLRTLVPQTMGAGKTTISRAEAYRLLRYGGADRILFMVDRINLGEQALREFRNYQTPDDGRKLGELYNVQLLRSNHIDPAANVVITTIQRLYSMLCGEAKLDPDLEAESTFEVAATVDDSERLPVSYQPKLPIETFDFVFADECHRSIYGRWGQVLDYFDAFLVGLTATPSKFTYGYFQGNVAAPYTHEQSVIDGVNVDYTVYRIETEISRGGSTVEKGEWVRVRDRLTRDQAYQELEDELTYDASKLDRAVVAEDQIRTVVRTFRDRVCTEIFPGRKEIPKTVVFCKHDSHAEDVLRIIREEFGRGSDFARKITYKTEGPSQQHIQDFRTDPKFRIAVSVDQISTGTDIKPIECLLVLRMVKSRALWEQMKGRGVRRIEPNEFWAVTPGAREEGAVKDHFVIVDCVGLTDEDRAWAETKPLDKKPTVPLKALLQDIGQGIATDELLTTVAARLARLRDKLTPEEEQEVAEVAAIGLREIAQRLIEAADQDQADEQQAAAKQRLVEQAVEPLLDNQVREKILSLQSQAAQVIDIASQDELLASGFADAGAAEALVQAFEDWIKDHHDEYVALRAYFEQPVKRRPSLDDIKALAHAIEGPPLNLRRQRLWEAYKKVAGGRVRGDGGRTLADIVSLVRFAVHEDDELIPYADLVKLRFDVWLAEQQGGGREFSPEQLGWLMMVRDHIAQSLTIEPEDFDYEPFAQQGGLLGAGRSFGRNLHSVLDELNSRLPA